MLMKSNRAGAGFRKIRKFCDVALRDGFDWAWVDTCCIDKKSSAELSEAITAMFRWYKVSARCYAYLSDVRPGGRSNAGRLQWPSFKDSKWFTRGWTLQELLAPRELVFLDQHWIQIGTRLIGTRSELMEDIEAATGIPERAHRFPGEFSVAQRMSWAANRQTSRVEDMAYCLIGLFGVRMPLLYGEGIDAFQRLQEEILRISEDESIFVWSAENLKSPVVPSPIRAWVEQMNHDYPGRAVSPGSWTLLARNPGCFASCGGIQRANLLWRKPYALTNKGLELVTGIYALKQPRNETLFIIPLNCILPGEGRIAMCVRPADLTLLWTVRSTPSDYDPKWQSYIIHGWIEMHEELENFLTFLGDGTIYLRR